MSSGKTIGLIKALGGPGGGGASDAVQYIPQELTESQQMQARKNLALPYKVVGDVTIVPETTVVTKQVMGSAGAMLPNPLGLETFTLGETYTVSFEGYRGSDGLEYEYNGVYDVVAVEMDGLPVLNVLPNDPELIMLVLGVPGSDGVCTMIFNGQFGATCTVSVVQKNKEIIVPLQPEYLPSEEWTFTLEDGSTVTKKVVVVE